MRFSASEVTQDIFLYLVEQDTEMHTANPNPKAVVPCQNKIILKNFSVLI